jgi:hypothetical protein
VEPTTEARTTAPPGGHGTLLGQLQVLLQNEPGTARYATQTQLRDSSDQVAREVSLAVGALLFAERQMRALSDPSRLAAVGELTAATGEARDGRLALQPLVSPRTVATYRIDLLANGGFRITVEQQTEGILQDAAGARTTGGLARELLATLREPYRTFYLEMLGAASDYWRTRRPSPVESTWSWPAALRRLDQLVRQGGADGRPPERCPSCQALRPAGAACLRCGADPSAASAPFTVTATSPAPAPQAAPATDYAAPTFQRPVEPAPSPAAAPVEPKPAPAPTAVATAEPEHSYVPSLEMAPTAPVEEPDVRLSWPLANLPRRLAGLVVDVVVGAILGLIGGFGLTVIGLVSGWFTPDTTPSEAFTVFGLIVAGLYFLLGWSSGETLGMLLFRLRVLRVGDRKPAGLVRAFGRVIGYLVTLAITAAVVAIGFYIDDTLLPNVVGTPDNVIRVVIGLIALYVLWQLTGQRIVGGGSRQTLGDQFARTIVAVKTR